MHRQNLSLPPARVGPLHQVPILPSSTTDHSHERLHPSRLRNRLRSPRVRPIRSTLQPALDLPPPERPRRILPSRNLLTELRPRSRSTSSCSACANNSNNSSSSHKPRLSNLLLTIIAWTEKRGQPSGMPQVNRLRNLALSHLGRRHHAS